jgi:hypothetical protein
MDRRTFVTYLLAGVGCAAASGSAMARPAVAPATAATAAKPVAPSKATERSDVSDAEPALTESTEIGAQWGWRRRWGYRRRYGGWRRRYWRRRYW